MDAFLTSKEIDLEHHKDLFTAPAFDSENNFDQYGMSSFIKRNSLMDKNNINNDLSSNLLSLDNIAKQNSNNFNLEESYTLKKLDQAIKADSNKLKNNNLSSTEFSKKFNKMHNHHHHHHHHENHLSPINSNQSPAEILNNNSNLLNNLLKGKTHITSSSPSEFVLNKDNNGKTNSVLKNEYQNPQLSPNKNQYLSPLVQIFNNKMFSPMEDEKVNK